MDSLLPAAAGAIMTGAPLPEPPPPPPSTDVHASTAPDIPEERQPSAALLLTSQTGDVSKTIRGAVDRPYNAKEDSRGSGSPSHLVVLSHGLVGTPEDLTYLKESLERAGGSGILVHSARRNEGKTKDGVAEGGSRLAEEILSVVNSSPSLSRISLVGNSLGGLYVRYAAKLLYRDDGGCGSGGGDDGEGGTGWRGDASVAGLTPSVFMTIATPHLGVRRFTYVPLPSRLHPLAKVIVGKTGSDLFLERRPSASAIVGSCPPVNPDTSGGTDSTIESHRPPSSSAPEISESSLSPSPPRSSAPTGSSRGDGSDSNGGTEEGGSGDGDRGGRDRQRADVPLLYEMATSEAYLRPLKAFRYRRAYANRRGDFMVPYGTAAFLEPGEGDGSEETSASRSASSSSSLLSSSSTSQTASQSASSSASGGLSMQKGATDQDKDMGATTRSFPSSNPAPTRTAAGGADSFSIADRLLGARNGVIVGVSRIPAAAVAAARPGARVETATPEAAGTEGERLPKTSLRTGGSARIRASATRRAAAAAVSAEERRSMEEEMAAGLNSCGWEKVSVDFGGLAPFSHNKICALSRTPLTTALYGSGRSIVDHAAEFLVTHDLRGVEHGGGDDGGGGADIHDGD